MDKSTILRYAHLENMSGPRHVLCISCIEDYLREKVTRVFPQQGVVPEGVGCEICASRFPDDGSLEDPFEDGGFPEEGHDDYSPMRDPYAAMEEAYEERMGYVLD